ncbi:MAG: hypothetical protein HYY44_02155 [Deltaproteobacteria bacterium]|nr:hypothetical protein [Deltaproteobacteria bacterium]MBI4374712.1 hypothetical protein [Deltaproteobacteria bacterium]
MTVPGTNVAMTAVTRIATVAMIAGLSLLAFTGTAEAQSPNQKAREEGNDPALKFSASAALAAVAALFFFIRGTRENRAFPRNWFVAGALALVTNVLAYYACKRLTAANKT